MITKEQLGSGIAHFINEDVHGMSDRDFGCLGRHCVPGFLSQLACHTMATTQALEEGTGTYIQALGASRHDYMGLGVSP